MSIVARHVTEWEVLDAPKKGGYHFPLETADPVDRPFANANLTPARIIDPRNRKPELELLERLKADGHDVAGAEVRIKSMHGICEWSEITRNQITDLNTRLKLITRSLDDYTHERGLNVTFYRNPAEPTLKQALTNPAQHLR
jgi:hypothetical protein